MKNFFAAIFLFLFFLPEVLILSDFICVALGNASMWRSQRLEVFVASLCFFIACWAKIGEQNDIANYELLKFKKSIGG